MEKKSILVTGTGGNVGQGILRNLRNTNYNLHIVGCDIQPYTAANFLCEEHYKVPYAYDEFNYISTIQSICKKEKIDLIIPSTDFETEYLSKHNSKLPLIAASCFETTSNFTDKFLTFQLFSKLGIPFANSYLPSSYKGEFQNVIAKPRKGRGSRGLIINPDNWSQLDDQEYMIQELAKGQEITTAFYVNKEGKLHSFISMERKLENGTTTFCKVVDYLDNQLEKLITKIVAKIAIKGSCNIQFILDKDNNIIPFEINGRISGTNSIRSNFGFEDVKWTVDELLLGKTLEKAIITKGVATRILMDVIFTDEENYSDINSGSNFKIY